MTRLKIPYKEQFPYQQQETPIWAHLLYGGIKNIEGIKKTFKKWDEDPNLMKPAAKGLIGQYLLNQALPKNVDVDLRDRAINYSINDNVNFGLGRKNDTTFLNLGWKF